MVALMPFGEEARRNSVIPRPLLDVPAAGLQIPEIHEMVGKFNKPVALHTGPDSQWAVVQCVGAEPSRDRAIITDRRTNLLERLQPEPRPILKTPAILVGALVVPRHQEVLRNRSVLGTLDVDDVETGLARAFCSIDVLALDLTDAGLVECVAAAGVGASFRLLTDPARRHPRLEVAGDESTRPEFHSDQRALLVSEVDHHLELAHVLLVPEARTQERSRITRGMDRAVLRVDNGPSALGLHPPKVGVGQRKLSAQAGAVRTLIEAIAHRLRTDTHLLEKDVVTWIPRHLNPFSCKGANGRAWLIDEVTSASDPTECARCHAWEGTGGRVVQLRAAGGSRLSCASHACWTGPEGRRPRRPPAERGCGRGCQDADLRR